MIADAILGFGDAAHWDPSVGAGGTDSYEWFSRVGRILLVGTSRVRLVFYEPVEILGLAHHVENMWHKVNHDMEAGGRVFFLWDKCDLDASVWIRRFDQEYRPRSPGSRPTSSCCPAACATPSSTSGATGRSCARSSRRSRRLDFLTRRCRAPHRLVFVLDSGIHSELSEREEYKGRSAFNGARLALVNHEMLALHRAYGLPTLDLFDPTASFFPNEGAEPYAHYYRHVPDHGASYTIEAEMGNPASRASALLVLDLRAL